MACSNCKWWEPEDVDQSLGVCGGIPSYWEWRAITEELVTTIGAVLVDANALLYTLPTFGCAIEEPAEGDPHE